MGGLGIYLLLYLTHISKIRNNLAVWATSFGDNILSFRSGEHLSVYAREHLEHFSIHVRATLRRRSHAHWLYRLRRISAAPGLPVLCSEPCSPPRRHSASASVCRGLGSGHRGDLSLRWQPPHYRSCSLCHRGSEFRVCGHLPPEAVGRDLGWKPAGGNIESLWQPPGTRHRRSTPRADDRFGRSRSNLPVSDKSCALLRKAISSWRTCRAATPRLLLLRNRERAFRELVSRALRSTQLQWTLDRPSPFLALKTRRPRRHVREDRARAAD